MSIIPRIAKRGETSIVLIHTRIINEENSRIFGRIKIKIIKPNGTVDHILKKISIGAGVTLNRYFPYSLVKKSLGKYKVDTTFHFDGGYIKSETAKTDFFDYVG